MAPQSYRFSEKQFVPVTRVLISPLLPPPPQKNLLPSFSSVPPHPHSLIYPDHTCTQYSPTLPLIPLFSSSSSHPHPLILLFTLPHSYTYSPLYPLTLIPFFSSLPSRPPPLILLFTLQHSSPYSPLYPPTLIPLFIPVTRLLVTPLPYFQTLTPMFSLLPYPYTSVRFVIPTLFLVAPLPPPPILLVPLPPFLLLPPSFSHFSL
jgi:hypothetical protein